MRKVIDTMKKERIPTIFSESTISDKPARQVAREAGAHYGGVLYVDSLSAADGPVPTGSTCCASPPKPSSTVSGRDEEAAMNAAQAGLYVDQLTVTGATATLPCATPRSACRAAPLPRWWG